MIKLSATAPIHSISPVIDIPSKSGGNPFQKRELILDDSWLDRDNQPHQSLVVIEATGDKMDLLNQFAPGMRVSVDAVVCGRAVNGRVFNTIRLLGISQPAQQTCAAPAIQPQAPAYPQQPYQQPQYPNAAPYPQQGYAPAPYPQSQQPTPQQQQGSGLPF